MSIRHAASVVLRRTQQVVVYLSFSMLSFEYSLNVGVFDCVHIW